MSPPKQNKNPSLPTSSYQYPSSEILSNSPKIQALLKISPLHEKIRFMHEWSEPLSHYEISYFFALILHFDMKVYQKHAWSLLKRQESNVKDICLEEIRECMAQYERDFATMDLAHAEKLINSLGSLVELGEDVREWCPRDAIMAFFVGTLERMQQMHEEKMRGVEKPATESSAEANGSLLSAQEVRFIMVTYRAMSTIIAKTSTANISTPVLERILNHAIKRILYNPHMSADSKRLASLILMNIIFENSEQAKQHESAYAFLREAFFGEDASRINNTDSTPEESFLSQNFFQALVTNYDALVLGRILSLVNSMGYMCLVRGGIAVPPLEVIVEGDFSILMDGFMPKLIQQANHPTDGKEQLYAIHALHLAVNQLKTYLSRYSTESAACSVEERIVRALKSSLDVVWNNWENPVTNISDRVREVFQGVMDAHESLSAFGKQSLNLEELSAFLLHTDWNRKGKYTCLNMLLPIVGVEKFFEISPHLFAEVLRVIDNVAVSTPASYFYADIASNLLENISQMQGKKKIIPDEKLAQWRTRCVDPLVDAMCTARNKNLRQRIIMYPVVKVAKLHTDIMPYILQQLKARSRDTTDARVSSRAIKSLAHLLMLSKRSKLVSVEVIEQYYEILEEAFLHSDEDVRTHSIEAITASAKSSVSPSEREMEMAHRFMVANLRNCPASYRARLVEIFKKFFIRVRDSSRNIFVRYKKANQEHCLYTTQTANIKNLQASKPDYILMMHFIARFMKTIEESLYPGCPHEKILVAIELYQQAAQTFKNEQDTLLVFHSTSAPVERIIPHIELFGVNYCNSFLNANFDCWDRIRAYIYEVLLGFPTPLPGYQTSQALNCILENIQKLMERPRLRESDAGALVLRLIFNKYVKELGWHFTWDTRQVMRFEESAGEKTSSRKAAVFQFLSELMRQLRERIQNIRKDIFCLTKSDPLIGTLIAIRYALEDVDFEEDVHDREAWRTFLQEFSSVIKDITYFSIQMLADARQDDDDEAESDTKITDSNPDLQVDCRGHVYFSDAKYERKDVHALVVNCWLSIRETTMLVGVISHKTRLVSLPDGALSQDCLLTQQYFEDMGKMFMDILMSTKHNGAIDKSHIGFQMLCTRLLSCNVPQLAALPGRWLQSLIDKIEQNEASILRRSGGFPFTFTAILKSEPQTVPPVLMKLSIKALLRLCHDENTHKKVNSLNILRFLFRDSELGITILKYAQEAFMVALDGFCSEVWGVRNSSLMLYSALLQRTIGNIKVRENVQAAQNCVTSREFFSKYSKLRDYLLAQLQVATSQLDAHTLHPNLYPILLLLSRLTAAAIDDPSDPLSVAPFIEFVQKCAQNRNHMARSMAARALVPLVSSATAHEFVMTLVQQLSSIKCTNHAHGNLLQLYNFVARSAFDTEQLGAIVRGLEKSSHIYVCACPSLHKAFADIVATLQTRLMEEHDYSSIETSSELSSYLLSPDFLNKKKLPHLTGLDVALGALTKIHLAHLFYTSKDRLLEDSLVKCIDHWSTNTVVQSVKSLAFFAKTKASDFSSNIYDALLKLMKKPTTDPEQVKYALQALKTLCRQDGDIRSKISNFESWWNQIYRIHVMYTSCYIRAHSLEVLGILMSVVEDPSTANVYYEQFLLLLHVCCKADQPNEVRFACQQAIAESKVLTYSLESWIDAMVLCQDDDEVVRATTAYNMTPYIFGAAKKVQVEYVIEKAYDQMGKLFYQDVKFTQHLWDLILLERDTKTGAVIVPFENVTLELFDEETENLFEEVKFRLDIARRELQQLRVPHLRPMELKEAEQQLRHVLEVFKHTDPSTLMNIGGLTYNGAVWTPFYRLLAGIHTGRGAVPEELLVKVSEVLSQDAFVHPMIAQFL